MNKGIQKLETLDIAAGNVNVFRHDGNHRKFLRN